MTVFISVAGLLAVIAMAFVLWPILGKRGRRAADRAATNVSLYRDQLVELEADLKAGTLSAEQFENSKRDIERRLLEDVASADATSKVSPRHAGWVILGVGVSVPLAAALLYLFLGNPKGMTPQQQQAAAESAPGGPHELSAEQVQKMVDGLAARLKQNPNDADGWVMLARSYNVLARYADAASAFAKATALVPNDAQLLADYADALAMTQDKRFDGEPLKLIQQALKIDPNNVKALALAGTEAFDRKDYPGAIKYWEQIVKVEPPNSEFSQQVQANVAEAKLLAGGKLPVQPIPAGVLPAQGELKAQAKGQDSSPPTMGAAVVKGKVTLSPSLGAKAAPEDTLFIFARAAEGPRIPLAMMRKQVKDLPIEFALDDSMAMMPNLSLSKFPMVIIGARISKRGDATAQSGDLQGLTNPVKVGSTGINVEINQLVP